ncbi:aspartate/glutamate racemase family protein, partial [Paraburkholderia kirstenboschensis]
RYGMRRFCRNVRATDVAVLDLDKPGSAARRVILDECRRALDEDGSDAIVLGCAGMAELCAEIEDALGAPVIEGVTAAVKWTEALVSLRLSTAKRGDYARPLPKRYDGALESFSPSATDPNPVPPRVVNADSLRVNTSESEPHIHSV